MSAKTVAIQGSGWGWLVSPLMQGDRSSYHEQLLMVWERMFWSSTSWANKL